MQVCRLKGQSALQRPQIMQKMRSRYGRLHQSTGPVEPGFRRGTDLLDFGSTAKPRVVRFLKKKLVLWNSTALHPPEKSGTNLRNLKSSVKSVKSLVDSEYMEIFWNQTIKPRNPEIQQRSSISRAGWRNRIASGASVPLILEVKFSRYRASRCTNLADTRFWIGLKNFLTQIYVEFTQILCRL